MALVAAASAATAIAAAPIARAQVPPVLGPTTTTTTAPSSGPDLDSGSSAPEGAEDAKGDGAPAPAGGIRVPPEAQRIIDAVPRTGPRSSQDLLDRLDALRELGMPEEEVLRVGMGRFPIAGAARYSHDWLYPRYGPGFRFHLGTDVFAPYGTPVRAPVDGVARSKVGGLGGITVKVFMPDGTYIYLAHLSGIAKGFTDGMAVKTGDIVGYVGTSGNAQGTSPHTHIGIYPQGGPPVDPKPVLDGFLAEATARVPQLAEAYRAALPEPAGEPAVAPIDAPTAPERSPFSAALLRDLAAGTAPWPLQALYLASLQARR